MHRNEALHLLFNVEMGRMFMHGIYEEHVMKLNEYLSNTGRLLAL